MQLFRMREPNMRKHEYYTRLQRIMETDFETVYKSAKKARADGREISPEEILRNILIKETSVSPPKSTNQSLVIYPGQNTGVNVSLSMSRA